MYPSTELTVSHKEYYLEYRNIDDKPSSLNTDPVIFNDSSYTVDNFRIYSPSIHTFNGKRYTGELIITHKGGPRALMVCIPLRKGSMVTSNTSNLESLISEGVKLSYNQPPVKVNLTSVFSLSNIVPTKPFYSYRGKSPINPCGLVDFVVFDQENALYISNGAAGQLSKHILPGDYKVHRDNGSLAYNSSGAIKGFDGNKEDDIYINCQPTGEMEGTSLVAFDTGVDNLSTDMLRNIISIGGTYLAGAIIMIIILGLLHHAVTWSKANINKPNIGGTQLTGINSG